VLDLCQRIDCAHDERSRYPEVFSGGVRITLKDGTVLEQFEQVNRGAEGQLLPAEQVRDKFMANCALSITAEAAESIWQCLMQLDELEDVASLTALLRTE
jgi:uncharacterized protein YifE (UPF0438 family)